MYILINRDSMELLYKHECPRTLANLVWIEARFASSYIFPFWDATDLKKFTDLELKFLYKSLTKFEGDVTFTRHQIIQIIWDLIESIKVTEADPVEAQNQAEYIPDNSQILYKYVYGSHRPASMQELFTPTPMEAKRDMKQEAAAVAGKLPSLQRVDPEVVSRVINKVKATVPTKAKSGPKAGTAKSIIWSTADLMWEEAGKPTDRPLVLKLRKEIMNKLEVEEGIKRTSASSELGQWNKARVH